MPELTMNKIQIPYFRFKDLSNQVLLINASSFIRQLYLDVVGVREEHGETIDAHAPAGSWRQSVF